MNKTIKLKEIFKYIIAIGFVTLTSAMNGVSFLDIIPFYWRFFGSALIIWGVLLLLIYLFIRRNKQELGEFVFRIALYALFLGLLIYFFYPLQYSDERPDGVLIELKELKSYGIAKVSFAKNALWQ